MRCKSFLVSGSKPFDACLLMPKGELTTDFTDYTDVKRGRKSWLFGLSTGSHGIRRAREGVGLRSVPRKPFSTNPCNL
jgi:hypothetical protein